MANSIIKVNNGSVTVEADGVKTVGQLLQSLQQLVDFTKINSNSKLVYSYGSGTGFSRFNITSYEPAMSFAQFTKAAKDANGSTVEVIEIGNNFVLDIIYGKTSDTNVINNVLGTGRAFTLYY